MPVCRRIREGLDPYTCVIAGLANNAKPAFEIPGNPKRLSYRQGYKYAHQQIIAANLMDWQRTPIAICSISDTALEGHPPCVRNKFKKWFVRFQRDSLSNID